MGRLISTAPHSEDPRPAQRRARQAALLARIFGDALPDTTRDERDPESGTAGSSDEWLRSQVPPHHG
ncbi:hypothetical protein D5S18_08705 [Nocardia panacis]|uniref:Uncharacterized protein n=1 Tax=Nocardia panacis TaxID=2340916 RepID=A0A3A4KP67_9NOCA|nr:hypothetical protein D5S18_08705 [Nocardia panacis]